MVERKVDRTKETPQVTYNEAAVRNNFSVLEYSRTCQAAASGMAAGILGLTGLYGFVFYFAFILVQVREGEVITLLEVGNLLKNR